MPALDASAATTASAPTDAEFAEQRPLRQIGLKLLDGVDVFEILSAAMRTFARQRRLIMFLDGLGGGRGPMPMFAVLRAGFAAVLLPLLLGLVPGKRRRLAFAGPFGLRQLAAQIGILRPEAVVFRLEFCVLGLEQEMGGTKRLQLGFEPLEP